MRLASQKDKTTEKLIWMGMGKNHVNKFEGVSNDEVVENCGKTLALLANKMEDNKCSKKCKNGT